MTLRGQIAASPETLSDFVWAAEQRFGEAETLLDAGRYGGAVYLFGFAAEMWLKLLACRYLGGLASTPVFGFLGPVRSWMKVRAPLIDPESYHSLKFWAECLIRLRVHDIRPLSTVLGGELRHHVIHRLYEDWKVDLRYRSLTVSESHARRVNFDADWVRGNWQKLWR